jgi:hypothetical protein
MVETQTCNLKNEILEYGSLLEHRHQEFSSRNRTEN